MDDLEADYLREQVRDLERANRRWKAVALCSLAALALLLVVGGGTVLTTAVFFTHRARRAEMEARMQAVDAAEQARRAEMLARQRLEEAARRDQGAAQPDGRAKDRPPKR